MAPEAGLQASTAMKNERKLLSYSPWKVILLRSTEATIVFLPTGILRYAISSLPNGSKKSQGMAIKAVDLEDKNSGGLRT
jgi:hypothetical protein